MPCKFGEEGDVSIGGAGGTVTAPDPGTPEDTGPAPEDIIVPEIDDFIARHHGKLLVYNPDGTVSDSLVCTQSTYAGYIDAFREYHFVETGKKVLTDLFIDGITGNDERLSNGWQELLGPENTAGPFHLRNFLRDLSPGLSPSVRYQNVITGIKWDIPLAAIGEAALAGGPYFMFDGFEQIPGNPVIPGGLRDPLEIPRDLNLQVTFDNFTPTVAEYNALRCIICRKGCQVRQDGPSIVTPDDFEEITYGDNQAVVEQGDVQPPEGTQPAELPETISPGEIEDRAGPLITGQASVVINEELRAKYGPEAVLSRVNSQLDLIRDPIRRHNRAFWLQENNSQDWSYLRWGRDVPYRQSDEFSSIGRVSIQNFESWSDPLTPELNTSMPAVYEQFVLEANVDSDRFKTNGEIDYLKWKNFAESFTLAEPDTSDRFVDLTNNQVLGKVWEDTVFELPTPYDRDRFQSEANIPGDHWADITPQYNFFVDSYEGALEEASLKEGMLPLWYDFLMQELNDRGEIPENFAPDLTLMGNLSPSLPTIPTAPTLQFDPGGLNPLTPPVDLGRSGGGSGLSIRNGIGDYLIDFSSAASGLFENLDSVVEVLEGRNRKDVIVRPGAMEHFNNNFGRRFAFPMHVDVEMYDDQHRLFVELMDQFEAEVDAQNYAINQFYQRSKTLTFDRTFWIHTSNYIQDIQISARKEDLLVTDLNFWLENVLGQAKTDLLPEIEESSRVYGINEEEGISNQLSAALMKAKMRQMIKDNMRSYLDILAGVKAPSETMMYRVTKHEVDSNGAPIVDQPVQTFWLPSSDRYAAVRFADNQVKYNKEYVYAVAAYRLVVGSKYQYVNATMVGNSPETLKMNVGVVTIPSIKLVPVPIFQENIYVLDRPPMPPHVDLDVYKGVDDEVLLRFQPGLGRALLRPVNGLDDEDREKFYKAQQRDPNLLYLWYENDDINAGYEIWATRERPTSYRDFSLIRRIETEAGAAGIVTVSPNVKYYMTFIAYDVHGHRSNPTPIYEIQIVNNDGAVYFDKRVVELDEGEEERFILSGRRYMSVVPAEGQVILNQRDMGVTGDTQTFLGIKPILGVVDDQQSIFGKTFKIRVTSKHTGKKFDLIFDYNQIHDES